MGLHNLGLKLIYIFDNQLVIYFFQGNYVNPLLD